jgi:tape measure domain-containing protein
VEGGDLRMSGSIDERVVQMKFDNKAFELGVASTMKSLDALNKSLSLTGATKGLTDLGAAAKGVSLTHLETGVQSIADKFKAMSVIGIAALASLATKAISVGTTLLKSLTVEPVNQGLKEYETNLNSIQTILANTGLEGPAGLKKVTDALDELNHYSDQTIYNFSEMAKNIGTFTAAGVTLKVATEAIKGIANLAAVSGSNAQQASTAMYQLSQAISAGKLTLEDWNSVVNAGMGGKVFQDSLMETARVHGVAIDKMVKDAGSFRLTLQEGWLTGEILTETLSKFTGDLTAGQLKSMGYNQQQIAGILKMGQVAQDAATKVKTMSQLINTLQEGVTSGWAKTWQLILGDFDEAKTLFTGVNNVLGGFVSSSADARNKVIEDWKELGGRTSLIYSIKNAWDALLAVVKPIKEAFRQIFPATTGEDLFRITTALRMFTEGLKISGETADRIHRIFAGIFALFAIGWDIVKAIVGVFFDLGSAAGEGSGGVLEFLATIGDFLVATRAALQQGNAITKVFKVIGQVLKVPIQLLGKLANFIGDIVSGFDAMDAVNWIAGLVGKLAPLGSLGDLILKNWARLPALFGEMLNNFFPFAKTVADFFANMSGNIGEVMGNLDFTKIFAGAGAASFISILIAIRNIISRFGGGAGGILDGIGDSLDSLGDSLGAMQNTLRATTLLQIAAAVGVLTLSVVALSKIDAAGLTRALTAISVMFTQLFTSMAVFEKFMSVSDIPELIALGAALILVAVAVDVLASAVVKMGALDWNGLAKGLTGVLVLLAAMAGVAKIMTNPAGLISTAAGMVVLAVAIKILVSSVEDLSTLDWEDLAKGLIGVGTLLGALILFTKFAGANAGGILSGAGIVLLAAGIKILASAVKDFAGMSWDELGRGLAGVGAGMLIVGAALALIPPTAPLSAAGVVLVATALGLIGDAVADMSDMSWMEIARGMTAMAGALALITAALMLIPPSSLLSAAAVLVVAASLGMISDALKDMASMSWEEIAKSLVALAGALTIIAIAMYAMEAALPGAAALLVVAASLAILAPVLVVFGQMSWEEMGKGLLMLAGALTVIGVAGLLLTPVIPTLIGLGVAVTLLGIGMLAAGAGVLLFAIGLTALSVAALAGTAALVGMIAALAGLIPLVLTKLGEGLVAFANVIATAGPAFTAAMTAVLMAIITAIDTLTPKIIATLFKLLNLMLNALEDNVPVLQAKGLRILLSFLEGLADGIPKILPVTAKVIRAFIDGISRELPGIIQSGVNLIVSFIEGLARAVRSNSDRMSDAGLDLASAIIEGMVKGLAKGGGRVADAARNAAKKALDAAKSFLGINSPSKRFEEEVGEESVDGIAVGFDKNHAVVEKAARRTGAAALESLKASLKDVEGIVGTQVELTPTITPVLDLTDVQNNASKLNSLFGRENIQIGATFSKAKDAALGYQQNKDDTDASMSGSHSEQTTSVTFIQNNTSPKALSEATLYRNTKNQLSVAKEALTNAV